MDLLRIFACGARFSHPVRRVECWLSARSLLGAGHHWLRNILAFFVESPTYCPMGKKILFVDDENDWREVAEMYLKDSGYEVVTARDATEALSRTEGVDLGLIILDLNLAGENGLMLMKFLKRNHP